MGWERWTDVSAIRALGQKASIFGDGEGDGATRSTGEDKVRVEVLMLGKGPASAEIKKLERNSPIVTMVSDRTCLPSTSRSSPVR